jgi:hypothetical protein
VVAATGAVSFSFSNEDLERIADAVVDRLQGQAPRGWLDVKRAADYSSLSEEAIRTAHKRGRLKGHKGESGRLVFTTSDLDSYMASAD